jgi:hypothetical protein
MLAEAEAAMADMALPDRRELLRRLARTLARWTEHLSSERLARSGFKWGSFFGAAHEDVIACQRELWAAIGEYARGDLRAINQLLGKEAGKGLVNGRGELLARLSGVPRGFPQTPELAADIWLVPPSKGPNKPDLAKMALDPEAFGGKQYTDRALVSFAGTGSNRWMAAGGDVEIKVTGKKSEAGKQFAKSKPRRERAAYQVMTIVDGQGKFLRREVIPVEQIVINPGSATAYGVTSSTTGVAGFVLKAPRGASGLKKMHWRFTAAVRIEATKRIVRAMLSRRALYGKGLR